VPQRKLAARLFDIEHKVRHRPGVAQRSGGLDIAQRRKIIPVRFARRAASRLSSRNICRCGAGWMLSSAAVTW
jgi:hypothetical protein